MNGVQRVRILDSSVDALDFDQALDAALALAKDKTKTSYVVAVNPEKVMTVNREPFLSSFFENADLALPDGIGVVLAARILLGIKTSRVPGVELATAICRASGSQGLKIFLYGAKEEVNALAAEKLREEFPDIRIVGRQNGYLPEEEYDALVDRINESGADVLFLALGSPRQERWIDSYSERLNVGLCMGIGGSLDVIAGVVKRAPKLWRDIKLEWLYRLLSQPSRWRRQRVLPLFVCKVLWEYVARRFRR